MRAITKSTAVEAFKRIIDIAPVSGDIKTDESGYKYLEVETLCVHITDPVRDLDKLVDWSPLGKHAMDYYRDQLVYGKHIKKDDPNDEAKYTYYQRLREYDVPNSDEEFTDEYEELKIQYTDQIDCIIHKLIHFRLSRRAVAVTWQPWVDLESKDPPCLDLIKFTIKENKLCLSVVFRSHDLIKGWINNIYALVHLMVFIAMALEIEIGYLEVISFDPHVYMSDVDRVKTLKENI